MSDMDILKNHLYRLMEMHYSWARTYREEGKDSRANDFEIMGRGIRLSLDAFGS